MNDWRLCEPPGKPCRMLVHDGPRRRGCGRPGVAEVNRGRRVGVLRRADAWWAYCADHLTRYGRVVTPDGRVARSRDEGLG